MMVRPTKWRCVSSIPQFTCFTPQGVFSPQEICLLVEEVEAVRLKDVEGLEQEECAQRMRISRPVLQKILASARRKLADALLNGKVIKVEGGNFGLPAQQFKCNNDGHEWQVPFEKVVSDPPQLCPVCNSPNIQPLPPFGFGWGAHGRHRFRGRK
jgi:predicted DNA-binding protein (UPF0251 family)